MSSFKFKRYPVILIHTQLSTQTSTSSHLDSLSGTNAKVEISCDFRRLSYKDKIALKQLEWHILKNCMIAILVVSKLSKKIWKLWRHPTENGESRTHLGELQGSLSIWLIDWLCLMPLSAISQLYHGNQL